MNINMRFRKFVLAMLVIGLVALSGCGKEKYVINPVDAANYNQATFWFDPIMKNEYGYYYKPSIEYSFHYYDEASGQSVFLCNRPECLHQGDEFCTATNFNYFVLACQMYDGKIYMGAQDISNEDSTDIVLLRLDADGSNLTEIAKIKSEVASVGGVRRGCIFIHRGICFLSYGLMTDEKVINCSSIYNMLDGTQVDLNEYEFAHSKDGYNYDWGSPNDRYMAKDEYVYFNEYRAVEINGKTKSKCFLCRYNIETQVFETAEISCIYKGFYSITGTEKTAYVDKFGNPYMYDWNTKESTQYEHPLVTRVYYDYDAGGYVEISQEFADSMWDSDNIEFSYDTPMDISDIVYYDGKLIAFSNMGIYDTYIYEAEYSPVYYVAEIDDEFNIIDFTVITNWDDVIRETETEIYQKYYGDDYRKYVGDVYMSSLRIVDRDLYVITHSAVYKCSFDAFLKGEEIPELLYMKE